MYIVASPSQTGSRHYHSEWMDREYRIDHLCGQDGNLLARKHALHGYSGYSEWEDGFVPHTVVSAGTDFGNVSVCFRYFTPGS